MREDRLLERIRRLDEQQDRRQASDPSLLTDSVTRHLIQILNSRQGGCQSAPELASPLAGIENLDKMARDRVCQQGRIGCLAPVLLFVEPADALQESVFTHKLSLSGC
eukprot:TRINITY_DN11526_c0_g1_i4.p2 TRINITY_DN11526_c0_g1~~TRINITY_DN11526_c0_g1_i4.p2  ORF type:complete len:108 (-),score=18.10 TRINITY_DN11526_c0_g1_i4:32-355(-)